LNSVTVSPLTSNVLSTEGCRVAVEMSEENGLRQISQVMVEKASTSPRSKAGPVIGRLSPTDMSAVSRAFALFLGFN
jgi:mRNA interferase MazF